MHHHEVICFTDSLHFIVLLQDQTPKFHKFATLIKGIKNLYIKIGMSASPTLSEKKIIVIIFLLSYALLPILVSWSIKLL
ncbi:hypothetical protein MtrunA17_Chr4g0035911 [Medicago truncatula]|nr:hypothetical protein MtrunA17_Chr4g0035911 [Medicago truncatula]